MMGCGPFAVPVFRALTQSKKHEVVLLVSQPPREIKGRVQPESPMVTTAKELGVPVWTPDRINNHVEELRAYNPDILVVCDFGQILSPDVLASAKFGGLNLHGSLLPKYRGAAPINWAILKGETKLGVTVIHLTPQLDAGPVVCQASMDVGVDQTAQDVEPLLAQLGAPLVEKVIDALENGTCCSQVQLEGEATRAPKLKKCDGKIDWTKSAVEIRDLYRALEPWPQTHFFWNRKPGVEPVNPNNLLRLIPRSIPEVLDRAVAVAVADPGTVLEATDLLVVQTGVGQVAFTCIQPAGKKCMDIPSFCRGYGLKPLDRFE